MGSLHKITVSAFIFFSCLYARGGDPFRPAAGAPQAGMGYVCIMRESFWSSFHNQALLPFNSSLSFGFNYENRFGIQELGNRTAGVIVPAGRASLGAVYNHFGFTDYSRQMAGIGCGLKLSDKLAAGVQADYFSENTTGEYPDTRILTCEVGLMFLPTEQLSIGVHIFNPLPEPITGNGLTRIIRAGAGTKLGTGLFAGIEAEMSKGRSLVVRTGFEYEALRKIWLRGGYSTDNSSFSFGLGLLLNILKLDLGFSTHERLGITSSASLVFTFPGKH